MRSRQHNLRKYREPPILISHKNINLYYLFMIQSSKKIHLKFQSEIISLFDLN